jgi:hypothetical protein
MENNRHMKVIGRKIITMVLVIGHLKMDKKDKDSLSMEIEKDGWMYNRLITLYEVFNLSNFKAGRVFT